MNILVVDDEPAQRFVVRKHLSTFHGNCDEAASGEQALEKLETEVYDLLILDIDMPGMTGIELLEKIRLMQGLKNVPVIIASAHTEAEVIKMAVQLGARSYLAKPYTRDIFVDRVGKCVKLQRKAESFTLAEGERAAAPYEQPLKQPVQVLIADDHPERLEALQDLLAETAWDVHALDGDALHAIPEEKLKVAQVLFVCLVLEDNAKTLLYKSLLKEPAAEHCEIVGLLDEGSSDLREEAQQAGIRHFLAPPLRLSTLERLAERFKFRERYEGEVSQ